MSAIQIKRGTTESWKWGPELIDFENLSISTRDSCKKCYKNTIELTIGGPSRNTPLDKEGLEGDGKVPGIDIINTQEFLQMYNGSDTFTLQACVETTDNTDLSEKDITFNLYLAYPTSRTELLNNSRTTCKLDIGASMPSCQVFLQYSGTSDTPYTVKLSLSFRTSGSVPTNRVKEGLLPGQLGCELDDSGNTLLKVGPHGNSKESINWSDIPYVGQVIPKCMYGTQADMDKIENPREGQIFYKKV